MNTYKIKASNGTEVLVFALSAVTKCQAEDLAFEYCDKMWPHLDKEDTSLDEVTQMYV